MTEKNGKSSEEAETRDKRYRMLTHFLWRIAFDHHKRLTGHADPDMHDDCDECYSFRRMADIINEERKP